MTTDPKPTAASLVAPAAPGALAPFVPTVEQAERRAALMADAVPLNTRKAYQKATRAWVAWAEAHGTAALPAQPEAIVQWVVDLEAAGRAPATIGQALAALAMAHRSAGIDPPPTTAFSVKQAMKAVRARHVGEEEEAAPILWDLLCRMLDQLKGARRMRNRAILLVGWSAALRRSELAGLTWEELELEPQLAWAKIRFRRPTKGSQLESVIVGIQANAAEPARCPVRALVNLRPAGEAQGPVFNVSTDVVNDLVKRLVRACGEDPTDYSAHSLRAGFVTQAFRWKIPLEKIMETTRHKDPKTLMKYRREADPITGSAAEDIWRKGESR